VQEKIAATPVISYSSALSDLLLEQCDVLSGDLSCRKIQNGQISYFYFQTSSELISLDLTVLTGNKNTIFGRFESFCNLNLRKEHHTVLATNPIMPKNRILPV
jgi:hypothetical protein